MGRLPLSGPAMVRAARYLISRWKLLAIPALLLGAPVSVIAEPRDTQRELASPEVQARWPAVGRVNLAGRGFCTGTLISDRLVLTAAHCMFNPRTDRAVRPESVHFLAGYRMGDYAAHRRGKRVAVSPLFDPGKGPVENLSHDIAIVELDAPIDADLVAPLTLGCCAEVGEAALVLSYGMDRPEALSVQKDCAIEYRDAPILVTDCEATPGVSGAPLVRLGPRGGELIGVISSMTGRVRAPAVAVAVDETLPTLRDALR